MNELIQEGVTYQVSRAGRGWACGFVLRKTTPHRLADLPLRATDRLAVQYWPDRGARSPAVVARSADDLATPARRKRAELLPADHAKTLPWSLASLAELWVYGTGSYAFTTVQGGMAAVRDEIDFEMRWLARTGPHDFPRALTIQLGKVIEADTDGIATGLDTLCGALTKLAALAAAWAAELHAGSTTTGRTDP